MRIDVKYQVVYLCKSHRNPGDIIRVVCEDYPELSFYSYRYPNNTISTPWGDRYIHNPNGELTLSLHLSCPLEPVIKHWKEEPEQEVPTPFFIPSLNMGWTINKGMCTRADGKEVFTDAFEWEENEYRMAQCEYEWMERIQRLTKGPFPLSMKFLVSFIKGSSSSTCSSNS